MSADVAQNAARATELQDRLWQLEDEADRTASLADQLQNDLAQSSAQQSNYIGIERSNLQALALAIDTGEPSGIALAGLADVSSTPVGAPGSGIATGRPLVVIRFDTAEVDYEPALFSAVSAALDRRPNAAFDVAAVSPASGSESQLVADIEAARVHADDVLRSLASMGLTEDRVSIISVVSPEVQDNEVHVFVR
jgi:TolA-binding protein